MFTTHDSIKELLPFVDDKEKYRLYTQVKECPIDLGSEFSKWKYWDEFSLSAYYQNAREDAVFAYSKLVELNLFPDSQRERILSNAQWFESVDTKKQNMIYTQLKKTLSTLQDTSSTFDIKCAHFIYLKGVNFGLHHFLAVLSCYKRMGHYFTHIFIYNDIEPEHTNIWWSCVKEIPIVKVVHIIPPTSLNGHTVKYKQHQADIIRLEALYHLGGVYFDLDMCTYRDFTELIHSTSEITMVNESYGRVSNAFIIAKQESPFIEKWIHEYHTKYGTVGVDWWAGLSVEMPHTLSIGYTGCTLLPTKTTLPFDYFYTDFFNTSSDKCTLDLSESYCIHLWDTEQQKRGILPETIEELKMTNSMMWTCFKDILEEYRTDTTVRYLLTEVKMLRKEKTK